MPEVMPDGKKNPSQARFFPPCIFSVQLCYLYFSTLRHLMYMYVCDDLGIVPLCARLCLCCEKQACWCLIQSHSAPVGWRPELCTENHVKQKTKKCVLAAQLWWQAWLRSFYMTMCRTSTINNEIYCREMATWLKLFQRSSWLDQLNHMGCRFFSSGVMQLCCR